MMMIVVVANWLLPLLYLALLIEYGGTFFLRTKAQVRNRWLVAVIAFHVAFLVVRGVVLARVPMVSVEEILSLLALSTAAVRPSRFSATASIEYIRRSIRIWRAPLPHTVHWSANSRLVNTRSGSIFRNAID